MLLRSVRICNLYPAKVLFPILYDVTSFEITLDYQFYKGSSQNEGNSFEGPYNKDYSIGGSILGSPYSGNYHKTERTYVAVSRCVAPTSHPENHHCYSVGFRV